MKRPQVIAIYDGLTQTYKKYYPKIYTNRFGDFNWIQANPYVYLTQDNSWHAIGGSSTLWVYLLDSNGNYMMDSNGNYILVKEDYHA